MMRISSTLLLLPALLGCGQAATDPCRGRQAGDLVVTELMLDPDGTDTGNEWFEVYNTTANPIELKGLTLFKREGSAAARTHLVRAGSVAAGGYAVLGDVRSGPNPAWVTYAYGDDLSSLSSAGGTIGVRCGTALILDEVTWTRPPKTGRSRALTGVNTPTATANDDEAAWCDTPVSLTYTAGNAGTPGQANPICQPEVTAATCLEGGVARAIVEPGPGDFIITEVMSSPSAPDTTGEWFELYAVRAADLNGLRVVTAGNTASSPLTTSSAGECASVAAGQYLLLARSDQSGNNGSLPAVDATTTLTLSSTNTQLTLQLRDGGVVDRATYPPPATNRSHQLRPPLLDALANDEPNNFCLSQLRFSSDGGGDYGTPKGPNVCGDGDSGTPDSGVDAGLMPGQCIDASSGMPRTIVKPTPGDLVITEFMPDPIAVDDTTAEWIEMWARVDIDLNGLQLADAPMAWQTVVPAGGVCRQASAGSRLLFARAPSLALLDGGTLAANGIFSFGLNNTGGDTVRVGIDGSELDAWAFTTVDPGASVQLSGTLSTPTPANNDVPSNSCRATFVAPYNTTALGSDRGTPGTANPPCL